MRIKTLTLAVMLAMNTPLTIGDEQLQQTQLPKAFTETQTYKQSSDQYIVIFKANASPQSIEKLKRKLSNNEKSQAIKPFSKLKGFSGYLSNQQREELEKHPDVSLVEPNITFSRTLDSEFRTMRNAPTVPWGLDRIDQLQLPLDNQFTPYGDGTGVHAYIIDSGISLTHSEFENRVVWDFTASDINDGNLDGIGYGTHLAGIVGGSTHGIAKNVNLHAVKVTNNQDQGTLAGLIEGIEYVTNNHISPAVAVIGISMPHSAALNQAIANASAAGISIAVPSGDEFRNSCDYSPASIANDNNGVISVAASTESDQPSPYSNIGRCVDLYAPGLYVKSTWHSNDYANNTISHSPTAAAHVAGVAAVIRGYDHGCSNVQVKNKLLDFSHKNQIQNIAANTINRLLAVPTELDESDCNGVTNQPPTITGTPATTVLEDEFYQFSPVIEDPDEGDSVTISIENRPSWAEFDAATGQLSGYPSNDDVGTHSNIAITAIDSELASTQTPAFNITVVNVNDAPTISSLPSTTATQDQAYSYTIVADDVDVGDQLTYAAPTLPSWLNFNNGNQTLSGTPNNSNVGNHTIQVTVSDGQATTLQDFQIAVANVNDAPTISGSPAISVSENLNYSFTPSATDPDEDSLTYSISGKPQWANFNPSTGKLTGNPNGIGDKVYPAITITVSDGEQTDELTFSLTVVSSTYSQWIDTTTSSYSNWTPAISNQTSDFAQNRTYQQAQTRQEQRRQLDPQTLQPVVVGGPVTHNRSVEQNESRTVSVTANDWSETNRTVSGTWSPAPSTQTADFTQTRSYSSDQERTWSYRVNSQLLDSRRETRLLDNQTESRSVNVAATAWSNTDRTDYSNWTPTASAQTADFNQSRNYTQNRQRTWSYTTGNSNLHSRVETDALTSRSESRSVAVSWSAWANSGNHYDCAAWAPATNTIGYNVSYTQKRGCKQNQDRSRIYQVSGSTIATQSETRTLNEEEQRAATGVGSWAVCDSTFTTWTNKNSGYDYSAYTPAINSQTADFTQSRSYKQDQIRSEQQRECDSLSSAIRNLGTPIERAQTVNLTQSRIVKVVASVWADTTRTNYGNWAPAPSNQTADFAQSRSYTQNQDRIWTYQVGTNTFSTRDEVRALTNQSESRNVDVSVSAWNNTTRSNYGSWAPAVNSQTSNFNQSRSYTQNRERNWSYRVGSTNLHNRLETGNVTNQSESRAINVSVTAWNNTTRSNYGSWAPVASNQTANFNQNRSYTQNRERTWNYVTGSTNLHNRVESGNLANQSESRSVSVLWTNWSNSGSHYDCGGWSPATNTVAYNASFTQSRSCKQNQGRSRYYKVGNSTIETRSEARTVNEGESRSATGIGDWEVCNSTFTSWSNDGSGYNYSSYSPAINSQTSSFTQSRTYKQNQVRTEQRRECDSLSNAIRNLGAPIERTQTVTNSQSRTITVSVSGWSESSRSNYSSWSPTASSQTSNFTQSRSYTQNLERTWYYKLGSSTLSTRTQTTSNNNQTESRSVSVSYSGWSDSGSHYSCGGWSPATNTVGYNISFSQTRSCKQDQTRSRYYNVSSSRIATRAEDRTINEDESRSATGTGDWQECSATYSAWVNKGPAYDYTAYSPAIGNQTSNFNQTRNYKQDQERTKQRRECDQLSSAVRNLGSATIETRTQTGTAQRAITVSVSNWSNTLESAHSAWSPSISTQTSNFYQSQTYTQHQVRTWYYKNGATTLDTRAETRSLTNQSRSRYVTVSYTSWTNQSTSCGSWSPNANTKPAGQTFTQTRSCTISQKRNRVYKTGSTTLKSYAETRTVNDIQSRSATGTLAIPGGVSLNVLSECGFHELGWSTASGTVDNYEVWLNNYRYTTTTGRYQFLRNATGSAKVRACNAAGCGSFSNSVTLRSWPKDRACP